MMKTIEKQSLIKGTFEPDAAKEILYALFSSKIKHHNISAFGISIRTGKESTWDRNRMEELKAIEEARVNDLQLVINCDVNIKLKSKLK
jgi:hypothetical protein